MNWLSRRLARLFPDAQQEWARAERIVHADLDRHENRACGRHRAPDTAEAVTEPTTVPAPRIDLVEHRKRHGPYLRADAVVPPPPA